MKINNNLIGVQDRKFNHSISINNIYPIYQTPKQAKIIVFLHWNQLNNICMRRFPQSENLAHEGLIYVLGQLEVNNWKRICTWKGSGKFITFLNTLVSHLLTDFTRSKFGHIRMPKWLYDKRDLLWSLAYRLLIIEQYKRYEVINILTIHYPQKEYWFIDEIVSVIISRCRCSKSQAYECNNLYENYIELDTVDFNSKIEQCFDNKELMEAFSLILNFNNKIEGSSKRICELALKLKCHINLTNEDLQLMQLRLIDGLKMKDIVKKLKLSEDPYKHYYKILKALRHACFLIGINNISWD